MMAQRYRISTKALVSAIFTVGFWIAGVATASADEVTPTPNPFSGLTCGCGQAAVPAAPVLGDEPAVRAEMERGIHAGLASTAGYHNFS